MLGEFRRTTRSGKAPSVASSTAHLRCSASRAGTNRRSAAISLGPTSLQTQTWRAWGNLRPVCLHLASGLAKLGEGNASLTARLRCSESPSRQSEKVVGEAVQVARSGANFVKAARVEVLVAACGRCVQSCSLCGLSSCLASESGVLQRAGGYRTQTVTDKEAHVRVCVSLP